MRWVLDNSAYIVKSDVVPRQPNLQHVVCWKMYISLQVFIVFEANPHLSI